jgi:uncharacterized membrane protein
VAPITAVQSNAMPAGGPTATQPVPPNITPADLTALIEQMTPTVARFRQSASPQQVPLDSQVLNLGGQAGVRIASVGLGVRVVTHWQVVINLVNAAAGAQVVNVSDIFPFNLIANSRVQINGGATVYSAGGLATFATMTRNRPAAWKLDATSGFGPALNKSLVKVTIGANLTPTNKGQAGNFSGITSLSIAASSTGVLTVDFYTVEKLCLDRESLLGCLPLQNNSTYATLTRQMVSNAIGAGPNNHSFPLFTAGAVPGTLTHNLTATITSTYDFWSVPPDPGLYQEMVMNSYQVQEQPNLTVAATGAGALVYNIPQNQYLVAAHIWAFDSQGNLLPADVGGLPFLKVQYNAGGVIPIQHFADRMRAAQFLDYGDDRQAVGGYRLWDGEDTTEDLSDADQAGWIDTYAAATPQVVADVASGLLTPINYALTRESVVAGAVQVVGG